MKRLLCLLLVITAMISLCACQGNFGSVNLKDPVKIPKDGVITESTVAQIKNENAIAVFVGTSGDLKYEWTVFGSGIITPKEINLGLQLTETEEESICVFLKQAETFGFSASLAIYLNEQWNTQTATAYAGDNAIATVSITGSNNTILNLNLDGTVGEFVICADPLPEENIPSDNPDDTKGESVDSAPEQDNADSGEVEDNTENKADSTIQEDDNFSKPEQGGGKDKYHTDPVPEGKPTPVEPEDQDVDKEETYTYTCTFSIECSTILNNLEQLDPEKLEMVPSGGVILEKTTVTFYEGESVFDVLQRVCKEKEIHLESSWTPIYNSAYVEGIHNLYEFDCGALSGWMYKVNGWYPNYGCSRYQLEDGDVVEWRFTCDLGNDIGGGYAVGG